MSKSVHMDRFAHVSKFTYISINRESSFRCNLLACSHDVIESVYERLVQWS